MFSLYCQMKNVSPLSSHDVQLTDMIEKTKYWSIKRKNVTTVSIQTTADWDYLEKHKSRVNFKFFLVFLELNHIYFYSGFLHVKCYTAPTQGPQQHEQKSKNTPGWHKGTADGDIQKDRDVKKMFIGMFYFCYKQKKPCTTGIIKISWCNHMKILHT